MVFYLQDPKDATTLANLVVCSLQLGKPTARYLRCVAPLIIVYMFYLRIFANMLYKTMLKSFSMTTIWILYWLLSSMYFVRISSQLKTAYPKHLFVERSAAAAVDFERAVRAFV